MTLPEANSYFAQWKESPPTHILVKALLDGLSGGSRQENAGEADRVVSAAKGALSTNSKDLLPFKGRLEIDENVLRERNRLVAERLAKRGVKF